MKHTVFETITPNIMQGETVLPGEKIYPCPVADFGMAKIEILSSVSYSSSASSLEICIVTEGGCVVNNTLALKRGDAIAVLAGGKYTMESSGNCTVFKAFVPPL
jgi:mannose-6-phosphate isomerase